MAVDKRGRKLPKGVRQRSDSFEGRFMYKYKEYTVKGDTISDTQKKMRELRYKLEHGLYIEKHKMTYSEWFETWMNDYKKNQVKMGTIQTYQKCYECMVEEKIGSSLVCNHASYWYALRGSSWVKVYGY